MRIRYVICTLAAFLACRQPLVDETYASLETKSINGADAFFSLFDSKQVTHSAYLTRKAQEADIIIHFEREVGYSEEVYRNLEAWMSGLDLEQNTDSDAIAAGDQAPALHKRPALAGPATQRETRRLARDPDRSKTNPTFAPKDEGNPGDTSEDEAAEHSEETEEATADSESTEPEKPLKPVILVYFLRDTTLSVEFWEKLANKLKEHPAEAAYCKAQASFRSVAAGMVEHKVATLFGFRSVVTGESSGPRVASEFSSDVFKEFPPAVRFRFLHENEPALLLNGPFAYQTLLLGDEVDLIREFYVKRGRVILIYNAESFLNYSMALPQHQRFAKELVSYILKDRPSPQIAVIDKLPVPPAKSGEKEESMFRVFTVFPLNVIFFQLFIFLVMFLLARAYPGQPLAQEAPPGSRDFTEHFRALGNLIRKSSKSK